MCRRRSPQREAPYDLGPDSDDRRPPWRLAIVAALLLAALVVAGCASHAGSAGDLARAITTTTTTSTTEGERCADNPDCAAAAAAPTTTVPVYDEPQPQDFTLTVVVTDQACFGSAGCSVTYEVEAGWLVNLDPDPAATYDVTYEVVGGEDGPQIGTMAVQGDTYVPDYPGVISTSSADVDLTATATIVRGGGL